MRKLLLILLCLLVPCCALSESALQMHDVDASYGTVMTCPDAPLPFAAMLPGAPVLITGAAYEDGRMPAIFPDTGMIGALNGCVTVYSDTERAYQQFPRASVLAETTLYTPDGTEAQAVLAAGSQVYVAGRGMDCWFVAADSELWGDGLWGRVYLDALQVDDETAAILHALLPNAANDGYELADLEAAYNLLNTQAQLNYQGMTDLLPQEEQVALDDLAWRIGKTDLPSYAVTPSVDAMTADEAFQLAAAWITENCPEKLDGLVGYSYRLDRADFTQRWHLYFHGADLYEAAVDAQGHVTPIAAEKTEPMTEAAVCAAAIRAAEAIGVPNAAALTCTVTYVQEFGDDLPLGYYWVNLYEDGRSDAVVCTVSLNAQTGEVLMAFTAEDKDQNG